MSASKLETKLIKKMDELMETLPIETVLKQNEVIIALLGRTIFNEAELIDTITKNKQKTKDYLGGYNACDGEHSLSDVAKIVGVSKTTLSPILSEWEKLGIIYEVTKKGGKFYKKLYYLNVDSRG